MSSKKSTKRQLTDRAKRARLKELGFFSKKTDLRKKLSRSQLSTIKKWDDVLTGKAKIIDAPSIKAARGFSDKYRVSGKKIVVPKKKGETARLDKKSGDILVTRKEMGQKITAKVLPKSKVKAEQELGPHDWLILPTPFGRYPFKTWKELHEFMARDSVRNAQQWVLRVEIETIEDTSERAQLRADATQLRNHEAVSRRKKKARRDKRK